MKRSYGIPPEVSGEFGARMEAILEVYPRPYDPRIPVVCLDEMPVQVLADRVAPLPMTRGKPKREDSTYERKGVATVFMAFEPLAGRRGGMRRVYGWIGSSRRRMRASS